MSGSLRTSARRNGDLVETGRLVGLFCKVLDQVLGKSPLINLNFNGLAYGGECAMATYAQDGTSVSGFCLCDRAGRLTGGSAVERPRRRYERL